LSIAYNFILVCTKFDGGTGWIFGSKYTQTVANNIEH